MPESLGTRSLTRVTDKCLQSCLLNLQVSVFQYDNVPYITAPQMKMFLEERVVHVHYTQPITGLNKAK